MGFVHIYTGNGKGKTTTMLGLALRAVGAGLKVYIGQFHKNGEYSEVKAIRNFLPGVTLEQYGAQPCDSGSLNPAEKEAAEKGLQRAMEVVTSGEYDLVMLDEINIAVRYGFISPGDVVDLINKKPQSQELVLTGRSAAAEVVAAADLVSEIRDIKHYFNTGVSVREGIEK